MEIIESIIEHLTLSSSFPLSRFTNFNTYCILQCVGLGCAQVLG